MLHYGPLFLGRINGDSWVLFKKRQLYIFEYFHCNLTVKIGKLKGTGFFLVGFLVICVFRFTFIGFGMQLYGIFVLFKSFIPFLYESACSLPFVGKYLSIYLCSL